MKNLFSPKWLYVINTAPIVLLLFLAYADYTVIQSQLLPKTKNLWLTLAISLIVIAFANFAIATFLLIKKKSIPLTYALIALPAHIIYLYIYVYHADGLIPFNIPSWMVSDNIVLYGGTFFMPTLAYTLFVIVVKLTPMQNNPNPLISFFCSLAVPLLFYIGYNLTSGLWRSTFRELEVHFMVIMLLSSTVFFLFFLARTVYIIASNRSAAFKKYELAWKIPVTLVFPILGLLANGGFALFSDDLEAGIFGDFSNAWFFVLAALNGIVLCLPVLENRHYTLIVFFIRSITFSYTFYFFVVFLPFLPLSVVAIIAVGIGFLMLSPLMLFIVHVRALAADFSLLNKLYSRKITMLVFATGVLVLPLCITAGFYNDKQVLHNALAYVYEPNYTKEYAINTGSLKKTLEIMKKYKDDTGRSLFTESQVPYISSFFNWIVLNNMTLSDGKINRIEKIFFGHSDIQLWNRAATANDNVKITNIRPVSTYDAQKQQWQSRLELEITNREQFSNAEYIGQLQLPDGCWINDYYLYIGNKKESGILAEKKAAQWLYTQITNMNRDPGILYYTGSNSVVFKVFPFAKNEVRKTGISFIHKDPAVVVIDGQKIQLGSENAAVKTTAKGYVSAGTKATLKKITRKPYYHFVINTAKGTKTKKEQYTHAIDKFIESKATATTGMPAYSFANAYTTTLKKGGSIKDVWDSQQFEGGFFAERAIRKILYDAYMKNKDTYPIIVLVTDKAEDIIIENDFSDMRFAYPENDIFYHLAKDTLIAHSLTENSDKALADVAIHDGQVLVWNSPTGKKHYLRNDGKPEVIAPDTLFMVADEAIKKNEWTSALAMQQELMARALYPESTGDNWVKQVKHSFASGVMTPLTSYMVVENEAQKAVLLKKQRQVLSGAKSLDLGEDEQRMSEPGLTVMACILLLIMVLRKKILKARKLKAA